MSYSGDAAEQVVRLSLETGEVAVKLAGEGAKQLAILLYAILREKKKTKGKTRLTNMLRSGKELKVFAVRIIPVEDQEAKTTSWSRCYRNPAKLFSHIHGHWQDSELSQVS